MEEIKPMNTLPAVPPGYASFGVEIGFDPVPPESTRQLFLGPEGCGKSYYAAGIPGALQIDFERQGDMHIPNPRAFRVRILSSKKLEELLKKLTKDAESGVRPFTRIIFDTGDQWVDMEARALGEEMSDPSKGEIIEDIRQWGAKGAGYSRLTNKIARILRDIEVAGYPWTVILHLTDKEITVGNTEVTVSRPVIHSTLYKTLSRNCEVVAIFGVEKKIVELTRVFQGRTIPSGQTKEVIEFQMRVATTGNLHGDITSKVRLPEFSKTFTLPNAINHQYGWDLFCAEYNKIVSETKAKCGQVQTQGPTK